MQCPFLFKTQRVYCKTGAFGVMAPERQEFRRFCCNIDYHRCKVYLANTGIGNMDQIRLEIADRLVNIPEQPALHV